ncbi:hypothetical protein CYMTET_31973 [Cymbomonas tetramitiformis]|uniref:4-alpha-glucanotransferase n=1 Tax=Cymbomonas tetramitiformis TaxID=36881 RepID=A0AAE0KSP4_9CHLO|nr:hypothetical protein CYMTET_31973 [Cymbomonas tetramitiformis]
MGDTQVITPDVVALREEIGAPGMLVLQFAWEGGGANVHLPHNHYPNSICYPGTHDNDTAAGWWASTNDKAKTAFTRYTGVQDAAEVPSKMIELGMSSVSKDCIMIMQDVIGLDGSARFNTPGTADGNWVWRSKSFDNFTAEAENMVALCKVTDRAPPGKYDNEDE